MENSSKKLPFFYIGKEVTEKRRESFKNDKYPVLCNELGKEDTLSIWYTRDHIVKLLEEIDHANGDGINLHFGAYEKGHEFEGQLCLVMNVTRVSLESSLREEVILEHEPDFSERSRTDRSNQFNQGKLVRDFNFGSPCPPRCDGGLGGG